MSAAKRIYLDNAATTPLLPEVRSAMEPWLAGGFGNPSSLHEDGRRAKDAIDQAREVLSSALGCLFAEVLFTSSGTEAANLAIVGAALANQDKSRTRVLLGAAEHHCVLHTQPILERLGYQVELIPVDRIARVRLDALEEMMGPDVLLVSVMHANNELGTIQPIPEVTNLAHRHGALYHCDAVQTLGVESSRLGDLAQDKDVLPSSSAGDRHAMSDHPVRSRSAPIESGRGPGGPDLVTYSAHKAYGPKGVGAIYIKAGTSIKPLTVGGGQERELRAGTENVAAIAGFAAAVAALGVREALRAFECGGAAQNSERALPSAINPRDVFLDRLERAGFVASVPDRNDALPGHAHVRLPGVDAETMLIRLDRAGISASSGAACSSGSLEPSHVLLACGYSEKEAREGLRFTFGRFSTVEDAEEAARRVVEAGEWVSG